MTDLEEQALHLILTEYYVERKGWTIQHHPVNQSKFMGEDGVCEGYAPDLTNRDFLWELVEMLNIQHIIIDPTAEGTWACGISVDGREWFKAIAKTIELALAQCLGKLIKEQP